MEVQPDVLSEILRHSLLQESPDLSSLPKSLNKLFNPTRVQSFRLPLSESSRRLCFSASGHVQSHKVELMSNSGEQSCQIRSTREFETSCWNLWRGFSLERLQLDYVDILHCHDIEFVPLDQIVSETIPALQKLKQEGKIRFIGITGLPLNIFTYVLDQVPPGTVDVILSYCHFGVNDSTLLDLLPYLKSKGVGVISASPLAMGLLTEQGPPEWHPASPELKSACKAAVAHCRSKGKKMTKLAVQYSLANKEISSVLVGMSSVSQVEENVAAVTELKGLGMDQETLSEVKAILEPVKNQTWPSGIDHK